MSKQAIIGLGAVVVAVVVGGVLLTTGQSDTTTTPVQPTSTDDGVNIQRTITAKHQYNPSENLHIVAGETDVPTPCHILDQSVSVSASTSPAEAQIAFEPNRQDNDQMCAQVITSARFKVTFEAPEETDISATYNGEDVELNLLEVGPDEDLEDFEIYTKG